MTTFLYATAVIIVGIELVTGQNRTTDYTRHPNWSLVNPNNCGRNQQYRIIGGHNAQLGQFPWMVRLAFVRNRADQVMMKCGGAIINNKYIVTAGHCFGGAEKLMFVRVGELDEYSDPDCDEDQCAPRIIDYEIESILRHAKYDKPRLYANDITIVRVKGEIEFNEFVRPICLEYGELLYKDYIGESVEVAGWGIYDLDIELTARVLQYVSMPVIGRRQCHNELKSKTVITDKQICAGGIKGKDSCAGDSGGPLMKAESVGGQPPRYFLLGIVSFGTKRCAKSTTPAVYTRVATYIPWILDHIYP